jgi:hypothetical protein
MSTRNLIGQNIEIGFRFTISARTASCTTVRVYLAWETQITDEYVKKKNQPKRMLHLI